MAQERSNSNVYNEKYLQKLGILHDHTLRISGSENFEEMAKHIFDAINATIESDYTVVGQAHRGVLKGLTEARISPSARAIPMTDAAPRSPQAEPGMREKIGGEGNFLTLDGPGIIIRAINIKKTCNVPDTRADQDYVLTEVARARLGGQTLSEIAVPVLSHGKSIGIVDVQHLELNAYDEADQRLLEVIAEYAGYSLSRIRYGERLIGLHRLTSELSISKNISETAEYTLDAMVNILDLESCEFLLVQDGVPQSVLRRGLDETIQIREKVIEVSSFSERLREASKLDFQSTLEVSVEVDNAVVAVLRAESILADAYIEQDKELLETLASHVGSAIQRMRSRDKVKQLAYKLNGLELGGCYLSDSHERCLKAYAVLSMEDVTGLCIIREDPQRLVDNYGIKKEEIVLLSSRPFEDWETLEDLQAVSRRLSRFLESGEGVVLLDGLEYLISRFGFDSVYSFVQEKRFDFLRSKAVLLVPLDMETIEGREKALLSSEFTLLE